MRRLTLALMAAVLLLCLAAPGLAQAATIPSYDQALDQLVAQGWPQAVNDHLASMPGTNPALGFYLAGTWADNARASYIADQMRSIGLKNIRLEPVPIDTFDFKSATVEVGDKTMVASTFAGVRPTSASGLSAQVVWAHQGTAQDFDALAASGVDVTGKLVLIDADTNNWWMNQPQAEATLRGAIGVIFTYGPNTAPWLSVAPDALGSYDSMADLSDVPEVYISQQDGQWLEGQLDAKGLGPVTTMKLIQTVQLASAGGVGYNVVGDLPGRVDDGTFVLFGAHHDGYFHTATDDTSGCTGNLLIAKAMVASGYRPAHTVRFLFTTGEEYGMANASNDWCIGAWWAITRAHRDWAGKIRAFLNVDNWSGDDPLLLFSTEFAPYLEDSAGASSLLPNGYAVLPMASTSFDQWTFDAAGVPTINFDTMPKGDPTYHSQYMTSEEMDWPYTADLLKYVGQVQLKINDGGLLPIGLKAQADSLADTLAPADLIGAGVKPSLVKRISGDLSALQAAASAFEARSGGIPANRQPTVNRRLLAITKTFNLQMTGLSPYQTSGYRHQQVLLDVQCLDGAIAALQQSPADTDGALGALMGVDLTYYGTMVSHDVYIRLMARMDPDYANVAWGAQGNPVWPLLDVMPQFDAIASGAWNAQTVCQLSAMRDADLADLGARLRAMSAAIKQIVPKVNALQ